MLTHLININNKAKHHFENQFRKCQTQLTTMPNFWKDVYELRNKHVDTIMKLNKAINITKWLNTI